MKKLLITTAATLATTMAIAAPAAAQWAPQPAYGYNQGYNNGYGYNQGYNRGYGDPARVQMRIERVRAEIRAAFNRRMLSGREASRLEAEANKLQYQFNRMAQGGFNYGERESIDKRLRNLEQKVRRESWDRNGRYDRRDGRWDDRQGGWGNGYPDRDRDGRDDRREDDGGREHDHH